MRLVKGKIKEDWEKIKPHVESILKDFNERPEDIYAECVFNVSHYFTVDEGFVILREQIDPITEQKELFIWLGYGEGVNLIQKYESDIRELARRVDAKKIVFASNRLGFTKVLGPEWKMRSVIYESGV